MAASLLRKALPSAWDSMGVGRRSQILSGLAECLKNENGANGSLTKQVSLYDDCSSPAVWDDCSGTAVCDECSGPLPCLEYCRSFVCDERSGPLV